MVWTEITHRQDARRTARYASDMTDREWGLVRPFLPMPRRLGRPRTTDLREVVNALLYIHFAGWCLQFLARPLHQRKEVLGRSRGAYASGEQLAFSSLRRLTPTMSFKGRKLTTSYGEYRPSAEGLFRIGMDSARPCAGHISECLAQDADCNWMCDVLRMHGIVLGQ